KHQLFDPLHHAALRPRQKGGAQAIGRVAEPQVEACGLDLALVALVTAPDFLLPDQRGTAMRGEYPRHMKLAPPHGAGFIIMVGEKIVRRLGHRFLPAPVVPPVIGPRAAGGKPQGFRKRNPVLKSDHTIKRRARGRKNRIQSGGMPCPHKLRAKPSRFSLTSMIMPLKTTRCPFSTGSGRKTLFTGRGMASGF